MRARALGLLWLFLMPATWHTALAQQYFFHLYDFDSGLNNLAVESIFQDHEGFLWVGTQNGLFRFDGKGFVEFGRKELAPGAFILSIHQTPDGTLWLGTTKGLYRSSRQGFVLVALPGLEGQRVNGKSGLASDAAGRLYVATREGLAIGQKRGSSEEWTFKLVAREGGTGIRAKAVAGVTVTREGRVIFGCAMDLCELDARDQSSPESGPADTGRRPLELPSGGSARGSVRPQREPAGSPSERRFAVRAGPGAPRSAKSMDAADGRRLPGPAADSRFRRTCRARRRELAADHQGPTDCRETLSPAFTWIARAPSGWA